MVHKGQIQNTDREFTHVLKMGTPPVIPGHYNNHTTYNVLSLKDCKHVCYCYIDILYSDILSTPFTKRKMEYYYKMLVGASIRLTFIR